MTRTSLVPATDPPIVICIRDPDYSNEFFTYSGTGAIQVYDIDLGQRDMDDDEERAEFIEAHEDRMKEIRAGHPARDMYEQIIGGILAEFE